MWKVGRIDQKFKCVGWKFKMLERTKSGGCLYLDLINKTNTVTNKQPKSYITTFECSYICRLFFMFFFQRLIQLISVFVFFFSILNICYWYKEQKRLFCNDCILVAAVNFLYIVIDNSFANHKMVYNCLCVTYHKTLFNLLNVT